MNCPICERLATSVYDEDFGYSWYCKPCAFGFTDRDTPKIRGAIQNPPVRRNRFRGVIRHVDMVLNSKERKIDEKR